MGSSIQTAILKRESSLTCDPAWSNPAIWQDCWDPGGAEVPGCKASEKGWEAGGKWMQGGWSLPKTHPVHIMPSLRSHSFFIKLFPLHRIPLHPRPLTPLYITGKNAFNSFKCTLDSDKGRWYVLELRGFSGGQSTHWVGIDHAPHWTGGLLKAPHWCSIRPVIHRCSQRSLEGTVFIRANSEPHQGLTFLI